MPLPVRHRLIGKHDYMRLRVAGLELLPGGHRIWVVTVEDREVGRRRLLDAGIGGNIEFVLADAQDLPFDDPAS